EFLPRLIGKELVDALLAGNRRYYRPVGDVFIPLEFADAAYRYGHAQIRQADKLNGVTPPLPMFPHLIRFPPPPPGPHLGGVGGSSTPMGGPPPIGHGESTATWSGRSSRSP